jgi:hypothetical protein
MTTMQQDQAILRIRASLERAQRKLTLVEMAGITLTTDEGAAAIGSGKEDLYLPEIGEALRESAHDVGLALAESLQDLGSLERSAQ